MPLNQRFCLLKIRFLITSSVHYYIITYNSEYVNVSQQFYTNDSKDEKNEKARVDYARAFLRLFSRSHRRLIHFLQFVRIYHA